MLTIGNISLIRFKNYHHRNFQFSGRIVGITGKNGSGKTNLLDAIYYLCFTKSYFSSNESRNVRYNATGFRLEGAFERQAIPEKVICTVKDGNKKEFKRNEEIYTRFSGHIGQFPSVMIAPDDAEIIIGGSEERRKFIDGLLSQLKLDYLDHLIAYNKLLQQRNSLLRAIAERQEEQPLLLDTLDEQLAHRGSFIFKEREQFLQTFTGAVQRLYDYIAGSHEVVDIQYQSALQGKLLPALLRENRRKDILLQRTSEGVHRDDLVFLLDGHPLKSSGSQGQRKSFLFALKLAQYEIIREFKQLPPLLLLDDIFEKLDSERISRLIHLVCQDNFGQVFITDTDAGRLKAAFAEKQDQLQLIELI